MRDTFVRTLLELAKADKRIELITGDLGFGVLKPFWEQAPNQFTNAGIAEQNMTSLAAGMALAGKTVFTYSIGNFPTLGCLEQIRNDCAYHHANVKVVCVGGGFVYGALGMSHHATEEIGVMRALPDVVVMAPGDAMEAQAATKAIAACPCGWAEAAKCGFMTKLRIFRSARQFRCSRGRMWPFSPPERFSMRWRRPVSS